MSKITINGRTVQAKFDGCTKESSWRYNQNSHIEFVTADGETITIIMPLEEATRLLAGLSCNYFPSHHDRWVVAWAQEARTTHLHLEEETEASC